MSARDAGRPTRVLLSTGPVKDTDNPYLHELVAGIGQDVEVSFLSARTALGALPDVFHVQWPHQLYRADGALKSRVKAALSGMLLRRLRRRRVPIVVTVHNRASHEAESPRERRILRLLERGVTRRIHLNDDPANEGGTTIRHPDYRTWLAGRGIDLDERRSAVTAQRDVLLFGMLRPYKGIEALLAAAPAAPASLTITGEATDPDYAARLVAAAEEGASESDPATIVATGRLDDAELVDTILRHRLVCLPYPNLYNSGALLYALSVGRPVLVPRSGATEALAAEVGAGWVQLYDGPLTAGMIATALARTRPTREAPPLPGRDAATSARRHLELYRELTGERG